MGRIVFISCLLAFCLQTSAQKFLPDVDADQKKILIDCFIDAKKGDAESQYIVGMAYLTGKYIEADLKQAEKWLKEAEKQNYADAYWALGRVYDELSRRIKVVNAELKLYKNWAIDYYKKAISNSTDIDERATLADYMVNLEMLYLEMVRQDFFDLDESNPTIKLFVDGADFGSGDTSYLLGKFYENKNNIDKAVYYYTKSADYGIYDAQELLGLAFYTGDGIVTRDYEKAYKYLKLACLNPNEDDFAESIDAPEVMNKLASCYRYGRGTKENENIANLLDYICALGYGTNTERILAVEGVDFEVEIDDIEKFDKVSNFLMTCFLEKLKDASVKDNGCKILYLLAKNHHLSTIEKYENTIKELQSMVRDDNFSNIEKAMAYYYLNLLDVGDTNLYESMISVLGLTVKDVINHINQLYKKTILLY